ncbi:MAG: hypothetical protein AAF485_15750 [Chloroflexota bacterium]
MILPNLVDKHALYIENREATAVIITSIVSNDHLVIITVEADNRIPHMRTWRDEPPYQPRETGSSEWVLSCEKSTIILDDHFAQGPTAGWQLLIDEESVEKFTQKDDSWVEEWF